MPVIVNSLVSAGEFLVDETARAERVQAFDELFAGSQQAEG